MIFTAFFNLIVLCLIFLLIFFILKVNQGKGVFRTGYTFKKYKILPIYLGTLILVALVFHFIMPYFQKTVLSEIDNQIDLNETYPLEVMSDELKAAHQVTSDKLSIKDGQVVLKLLAGEQAGITPIKVIEDEQLSDQAYANYYEVPGIVEVHGKNYRLKIVQSVETKGNIVEVTPPEFIEQNFKVIQGNMFSRIGQNQSTDFGFIGGHNLVEIVIPKSVEVVYDEHEFYLTNDPG